MAVPHSQPVVHLHIGPPKTGTTFIQDVLWRNRDELARQGVLFPGSARPDHFYAALDLRGMRFGGHDNPDVPGAWRRLVDAVFADGVERAVLSHEIFGGADEEQLGRVAADLAGAELHVVYGARDLARQLPAVWQESLKNRRTRTFDAFLTAATRPRSGPAKAGFWRGQDTLATLERWTAVVGADHIHVVTLPQAGAAPDTLWRRFAQAVGVDPAPFDLGVARPNSSLGLREAELLRRANERLQDDLPWPVYDRLVKRRFNRVGDAGAAGPRVQVPVEHRDLLARHAEATKAGLAAAGYDIIGDLADLDPVEASFASGLPDAADMVTDAEVDALVAEITGQAERLNRDPRTKAKALLGRLSRRRGDRDG